MEIKKVIGYLRVSTDGQSSDGYGLEAQREAVIEYCSGKGMYVVDWYIEDGVSGAKEERPQMGRILSDDGLIERGVQAVVVAKSDRVARDINIYYYYKHSLMKRGIELISVSEDFGAMGAFAPMLESFIICMAQMERTNITLRTSSGRRVKAAKGGYAGGRPPYGYEAINKKLYIVEDEANVVRFIFAAKLRGMAFSKIAEILNSKGALGKHGKQWYASSVKVIVDNEMLYKGYYRYGDQNEFVRGDYEAILNLNEGLVEIKK